MICDIAKNPLRQRQLSLRMVLAASLCGIQLVVVLTILFLSFMSSERALLRQSDALLKEAGENVISHVDSFLTPAQQLLDVSRRLAENGLLTVEEDDTLEKHLFQQLIVAPQIAGIYFAEPNGRFVYVMRTDTKGRYRTKFIDPFDQSDPFHPARFIWRNDRFTILERHATQTDTYEARTRPWYTSVADRQTSVWTSPYIYYTTRRAGITYAVPVLAEDGAQIGILGIDIEIDALSAFLSKMWEDKGGAAIIINRDGDVLAHPTVPVIVNDTDLNRPELISIRNIDDPLAQTAFRDASEMQDGTPRFSEIDVNGRRYVSLLMAMPNEKLDWIVGLYAPTSFFSGEILSDRYRSIWFALLISLIAGLVGLAIAERINRPLKRFASGTRKAALEGASEKEELQSPYAELAGTADTLMSEIKRRKQSEIAYGRTFDLTSRGMAQLDPKTLVVLRANAQFAGLLGIEKSAVEGVSLAELLQKSEARQFAQILERLDSETEVIEELSIERPSKPRIWLRVNALLVRDDQGAPDHVVVAFDDLSEQRQSEILTAELKRDISHLSRVNMMGEMASGLAHELNQPLSAIAHNVDSAKHMLGKLGVDEKDVVAIHEDIERQALRAGEIIHALRDFIRKDSGNMKPFDLTVLCKQTAQLMESEARARQIALIVTPSPATHVNGNRAQIAQVIVNLTLNAFEAIDAGDIAHKHVTISINAQDDETAVVYVDDTGIGVPQDVVLFEKFDTSKASGMGLGLSISRSIVQANNGQIWHEARLQGGARFCFSLKTVAHEVARD